MVFQHVTCNLESSHSLPEWLFSYLLNSYKKIMNTGASFLALCLSVCLRACFVCRSMQCLNYFKKNMEAYQMLKEHKLET